MSDISKIVVIKCASNASGEREFVKPEDFIKHINAYNKAAWYGAMYDQTGEWGGSVAAVYKKTEVREVLKFKMPKCYDAVLFRPNEKIELEDALYVQVPRELSNKSLLLMKELQAFNERFKLWGWGGFKFERQMTDRSANGVARGFTMTRLPIEGEEADRKQINMQSCMFVLRRSNWSNGQSIICNRSMSREERVERAKERQTNPPTSTESQSRSNEFAMGNSIEIGTVKQEEARRVYTRPATRREQPSHHEVEIEEDMLFSPVAVPVHLVAPMEEFPTLAPPTQQMKLRGAWARKATKTAV